jgi:hypothetical protein
VELIFLVGSEALTAVVSYGIYSCAVCSKPSEVLEEHVASIFRVEECMKQVASRALLQNDC